MYEQIHLCYDTMITPDPDAIGIGAPSDMLQNRDVVNEENSALVAIIFMSCSLFVMLALLLYAFLRATFERTRPKHPRDLAERFARLDELARAEKFLSWHLRERRGEGSGTHMSSEYVCIFCLLALLDEDIVRGLSCGHCFHRACIDRWFQGFHHTCPLCHRIYYTAE
ncbi:hypothetical protein F5884DRAFT_555101 [Xylogone sp. PMI_703]|nr:hypothetical protein F5884DRAFT_555101 [Xylogone sp. PMI_703]